MRGLERKPVVLNREFASDFFRQPSDSLGTSLRGKENADYETGQ